MAKFIELVERYPGEAGLSVRFRKATQPLGTSIGVRKVPGLNKGKPMLWVYDMGEPVRTLGHAEMKALFVDLDPDWSLANA